ncbi:MAG: gluconate 2-dehydrogenase subunit 3 family protein [Sphingomonadaceae bacterium]
MDDRFASYDVTDKHDSLSWNEPTRTAVAERCTLQIADDVLTDAQLATLCRAKERLCPDFPGRPPTTTLAMIVQRIARKIQDGTRHHALPEAAECWRRGLDAIEAEAQARFRSAFAALEDAKADVVLRAVQHGDVQAEEWDRLPPQLFWSQRLLNDLVSAHWAQPQAWSAMGFGGPASPRGYVRLAANRRDPWEAIEQGDTPRFGWPRHHGGTK